ncbi:DNA polymerase III delta prime subunit [Bradyrhizobium embrapense]
MYDFRTLSPLDFEELVRDLLQAELGVRFESFKPGKDQGVDFRFASGDGRAIVQAKHFVGSTFPSLIRACIAEDVKIAKLRPRRYLLATSMPLSLSQKSKIRAAMPSAPLIDADVLGSGDLNNLLGRHRQIEHRHFKLWLASSAVLERILHSGVYNRTETEMALIKKMTQKFVHNESVPAAEAILARAGSLIISGEPGVGKTTLARMLVWLHAEQGWNISVIDDIREAFELPLDETKRLIFFDDFLGQVALSSDLVRSTDQRFPPFLQKVRSHDNLRFVLTTRNYILRQAQAVSGRLAESAINSSEFVLDVGRYTRSVRAKMLYNHLYFSEMSKADLKVMLGQDFFLKIIDHRNFNPRLIDLLTSPDYLAIARKPTRTVIQSVLDNPSELWERPYRTQLAREARTLMLALYFNEPLINFSDLEQTFGWIYVAMGGTLPAAERPAAFRGALKELEGSVLAIQDRKVRFSNPGVRDFLDRAVAEDRFLPAAVGVLSDYTELKQCWSLYRRAPERAFPDFPSVWAAAMSRMVQSNTGNSLKRLALILESFDLLRGAALLPQVSAAADDLRDADLEQDDADLCRSLLEKAPSSALPGQQMQEVRDAVSQATGRLLGYWGGYMTLEDLDAAAGTLWDFGTSPSDATANVQMALKEFIDHIDETLGDIDNPDELDDFEKDLNALMIKFQCKDDRAARDIEYRRQAIFEGRIRHSSAQYGGFDPSEEEPDVSDEEIRSMFSSFSL